MSGFYLFLGMFVLISIIEAATKIRIVSSLLKLILLFTLGVFILYVAYTTSPPLFMAALFAWSFLTFYMSKRLLREIRETRLKINSSWKSKNPPHQQPLIFLDRRIPLRATILGNPIPIGYRLSCLYFESGLLDRTGTLDHGFKYDILDPIPEYVPHSPTMKELCQQRASELIRLARKENKPIRLFWSGGIDSTAACVAFLNALKGEPLWLEIAYSQESVLEYPRFFSNYVEHHPRKKE